MLATESQIPSMEGEGPVTWRPHGGSRPCRAVAAKQNRDVGGKPLSVPFPSLFHAVTSEHCILLEYFKLRVAIDALFGQNGLPR